MDFEIGDPKSKYYLIQLRLVKDFEIGDPKSKYHLIL
jgi:hypothetical protein